MTAAFKETSRDAVIQLGYIKRGEWNQMLAWQEALKRPLDEDERLYRAIADARLGLLDLVDRSDLHRLLQAESRRSLFRRFTVVEAVRAKRIREAINFAQVLTDAKPDDADDSLLLARLLRQSGDGAAAEREIERVTALNPDDLALVARSIMMRMREGDADGAAKLARANKERCGENERLAQCCIDALLRAGDLESAEQVTVKVTPDVKTAALAVPCHRAYLERNRPGDSLALCTRVLALDPTARLHLAIAEAMAALDMKSEEILVHLDAAEAQAPDDAIVLKPLGEQLLRLALYDRAVIVLKRAMELAPNTRHVRFLYARALRFAGKFEESAREILASRDDFNGSIEWHRQASNALLLAGNEPEASRIYFEGITIRRAGLQTSLREKLDQLRGETTGNRVPRARLDWAWNVATRTLGHAPSVDRADWERKAEWGFLADAAILDWLECRPQDLSEVTDLLDVSLEDVRSEMTKLAEKRGLLIASAHLGPVYAGPIVLKMAGLPFRVMSSTARISAAPYVNDLISTIDISETNVVRQILFTLVEKKMVTIAVDGAMSPTAPRIKWKGASITYSSVIAGLSRRLKVRSVFAQPYWLDGKITFDFEILPFPEDDEEAEVFYERWKEAYLACVLRFFTRGPENLRLAGGIWRHISSVHADAALTE